MAARFTSKQGAYLRFISHYAKLHGRSPSEAELRQFFMVSPPSVHPMVMTLEKRGLIARRPGVARSLRVLVPPTKSRLSTTCVPRCGSQRVRPRRELRRPGARLRRTHQRPRRRRPL
jgi:SOS-response transcriptional repressor LexA